MTATPERQRNQLQTAPPGQSQTHHRTQRESDVRQGDRTQNQSDTQATVAVVILAALQTHKREPPHAASITNLCLKKPPLPILSQIKRRQALETPPLETEVSPIEKEPFPPGNAVTTDQPNQKRNQSHGVANADPKAYRYLNKPLPPPMQPGQYAQPGPPRQPSQPLYTQQAAQLYPQPTYLQPRFADQPNQKRNQSHGVANADPKAYRYLNKPLPPPMQPGQYAQPGPPRQPSQPLYAQQAAQLYPQPTYLQPRFAPQPMNAPPYAQPYTPSKLLRWTPTTTLRTIFSLEGISIADRQHWSNLKKDYPLNF